MNAPRVLLAVLLLVGSTGCLGAPGRGAATCESLDGLGFWRWQVDGVSVTYTVHGDVDGLVVAAVNGTVAGVLSVERHGNVAVDGRKLRFRRNLSGDERVRLELYRDANDDDRFDPAADASCGVHVERTPPFSNRSTASA